MGLQFECLEPERIIGSDDFRFVERFLKATGRSQIGWHYIIDLSWIYGRVKDLPRGARVLDAGGGAGPTQFLLAELGFDVVNVDLAPRTPSAWLKRRYRIDTRTLPSHSRTAYSDHIEGLSPKGLKAWMLQLPPITTLIGARNTLRCEHWRGEAIPNAPAVGHIQWVLGNLAGMPELSDQSFDAVVSLSALEHIPAELLAATLSELHRVLKPDSAWALTTSGTERPEGWWHAPSKGHCFSFSDFERVFSATPAGEQNAVETLSQYTRADYLKDNLAAFYFNSGDNGMPWGRWDPQYIPVGIYSVSS